MAAPAARVVEAPTVGPILGHTTTDTVRIWIRGDFMTHVERPLRCHGVARVQHPDGTWSPHIAWPLRPGFDFTGVGVIQGLSAGTGYTYQAGVVHHSGEPEAICQLDLCWDHIPTHTARTAPPSAQPISFVFGSCRYMLRLLGGWLGDDRGDKAFRSIRAQIAEGVTTDLFMMLGDQIYADDLGPVAPDKTLEAFRLRYRQAFTEPHIRALMAQVPTYMMLDDHELANDWRQDRALADPESRLLFLAATQAYESYQAIVGPAFDPALKRPPRPYWYTFQHGAASFFALDTRTERFADLDPPHIISEVQMSALLKWLSETEGLKFVISPVPFFPDPKGNADKWGGFHSQRRQILEHIRSQRLSPVFFLSGDLHASLVARLEVEGEPDFQVYSLVSSAFFWPGIHLPGWLLDHGGVVESTGDATYRSRLMTEAVYSTDSFTRVTLTPSHLEVAIYHRKGELLELLRLPLP